MNPLPTDMLIGIIGELLVQIRLLEFSVQAARPIGDSGNDLIAIRKNIFKALQVKTTTKGQYSKEHLPPNYHILAVVELHYNGDYLSLDRSQIFLIPKDDVSKASTITRNLSDFLMTTAHIDKLFNH